MVLAFAGFQPWVVAAGLALCAIGFGACAAAVWYLRRRDNRDVIDLLMAAVAGMLGAPLGLAGAGLILFGLDPFDSMWR